MTADLSAFSQIIAVSAKMKHVVEQARKLATERTVADLTNTGTGKDLLPMPVIASPRAAAISGAELCVDP